MPHPDGLALGGLLDGVVQDDDDSSEGEGLDPFEAFQAALGQAPPYHPMPSSTSIAEQQSYGFGTKEGEGNVEGELKVGGDAGKTKAKAP